MSKKILFQLTGSIACYKACEAISTLCQQGHTVHTVATASALQFIGRATLEGLTGHPVSASLWQPGQLMDHIHLARWADILVLCPASAHTLNKLAAGLADDEIGALFLANNFRKPYLIAPAMNHDMLQHPATQQSLRLLKSWGATVLEGETGALACGESGLGRLVEPLQLVQTIQGLLQAS